MATDVDLAVEDGIAWLTMRRPETRNSVEADFMEAAIDALDQLPDGAGALVLAGAGPAFCVGVDLHMARDAISNGEIEEAAPSPHRLAHDHPEAPGAPGADGGGGGGVRGRRRGRVGLPMRPAGGGRLDGLRPWFPGPRPSPDSGTSFHLSRALGSPVAIAAFLRNRRITADELLARGLADEVAPDGQVWPAAQRLATRRLMDAAPTHSFEEHLDAEEAAIRPLLASADVAEGVAAFLERHRPNFQGARAR